MYLLYLKINYISLNNESIIKLVFIAMTTDYFLNMFNYDAIANQKILEQLENATLNLEKAQQIHSHILAAKEVWIRRLNNQDLKGIEIWPEFNLGEAQKQIDNNIASYQKYLKNITNQDLSSNLHYTNSKGTKFETPIRDILSHVLIHGGHHRGQIAMYVREVGAEPLNTDYITYVRN